MGGNYFKSYEIKTRQRTNFCTESNCALYGLNQNYPSPKAWFLGDMMIIIMITLLHKVTELNHYGEFLSLHLFKNHSDTSFTHASMNIASNTCTPPRKRSQFTSSTFNELSS